MYFFIKKIREYRPFIMALNWNHSLLHSDYAMRRGHRSVNEEVCID